MFITYGLKDIVKVKSSEQTAQKQYASPDHFIWKQKIITHNGICNPHPDL